MADIPFPLCHQIPRRIRREWLLSAILSKKTDRFSRKIQRFALACVLLARGLHYNWHRFYDPEVGRYISVDPLGLDAGLNVFGYAFGNPTTFVDPDGRFAFVALPWILPLLKGAVAVLGAASAADLGLALLGAVAFGLGTAAVAKKMSEPTTCTKRAPQKQPKTQPTPGRQTNPPAPFGGPQPSPDGPKNCIYDFDYKEIWGRVYCKYICIDAKTGKRSEEWLNKDKIQNVGMVVEEGCPPSVSGPNEGPSGEQDWKAR